MSETSTRKSHELWRTMSEPDIDPRLADGLRSNQDFAMGTSSTRLKN